jgi:hypothetical protein
MTESFGRSTHQGGTLIDLETARKERRWLTPGERPPRPYMTFTPDTAYRGKPCEILALPVKRSRQPPQEDRLYVNK